jgi:hypothetical protein
MRTAVVPFALFVCSFTLVAAQTASVAPTLPVTKTAPPPTSVNVLNFPEVQAVTGTVSVDNLPAVQTIGGTVNVGNLPLDADGTLRVTSAPAKHMIWHELLTQPLEVPGFRTVTIPAIVNTDGFSFVGVGPELSTFSVSLVTRWAADEAFSQVADARIGVNAYGPQSCGSLGNSRLVCPGTGGDVQVVLSNGYGDTRTITSVRVYLFP